MGAQATLTVDGKSFEYPVIVGTRGERAIDITKLRDQTGYITMDPGFNSTGACSSKITFIDGDKGVLLYRGIPIEEFAHGPNFMEVAYMLIFGKLPNADEYEGFSARLTRNAYLHEGMRHHFEGFPIDSPPMAMLSAMINVLACYDHQLLEMDEQGGFEEVAARIISKIRTIAAYSYRRSCGLPMMYPDPNLRYCANFLHMMFSMPYNQYFIDEEVEEALNLIFILHADHEQNCSTSTVRTVGSSHANLFASVAAGVSALWGPLHGGANVEVLQMLDRIHKGGVSVDKCIAMAKDKSNSFRLSGFGHRVYKNYDPRARMLKAHCDRLFPKMKINDPLLNIARQLEEAALKDSYFAERKLYPNVDFYSGILMRAMGIPSNMFTVMFAIGRLPGWIAHWKEQHDTPSVKITRPRQVYMGPPDAHYVPSNERA